MEDKNRNKEEGNRYKTVTKIVGIYPTTSTITLNVPTRRHRLSQRTRKQLIVCCLGKPL